jgi:PqqD family protein of HPr-rel-A system
LLEFGETSGARRWRLVPGQLLRAHQWDDEFVVYNDLSGDTHLIDAAAMAILLALQAAPAGMALPGDTAEPGGEDCGPTALDELLGTLEITSLIESIAC